MTPDWRKAARRVSRSFTTPSSIWRLVNCLGEPKKPVKGFSTMTCLPAAAAASMYSRCEDGGVQISSTSISGSISATEAKARKPWAAANASRLSARADVTPTTSTPLSGKFSR